MATLSVVSLRVTRTKSTANAFPCSFLQCRDPLRKPGRLAVCDRAANVNTRSPLGCLRCVSYTKPLPSLYRSRTRFRSAKCVSSTASVNHGDESHAQPRLASQRFDDASTQDTPKRGFEFSDVIIVVWLLFMVLAMLHIAAVCWGKNEHLSSLVQLLLHATPLDLTNLLDAELNFSSPDYFESAVFSTIRRGIAAGFIAAVSVCTAAHMPCWHNKPLKAIFAWCCAC